MLNEKTNRITGQDPVCEKIPLRSFYYILWSWPDFWALLLTASFCKNWLKESFPKTNSTVLSNTLFIFEKFTTWVEYFLHLSRTIIVYTSNNRAIIERIFYINGVSCPTTKHTKHKHNFHIKVFTEIAQMIYLLEIPTILSINGCNTNKIWIILL